MTDNWDDSDDEWDVDDDAIDAKLGLKKASFEDEEDLALKEKEAQEAAKNAELRKKGQALAAKKQAEREKQEELELAKKLVELEAENEANLSPDELRALKQRQIEEADHALTDDLFGGGGGGAKDAAVATEAGDKVVLKDLKAHLKHARRVAEAFQAHGKIHFAATFIKELLNESKDLLDDAAISDIIKTCNVIKNEKVMAAKKKVKGQPQKSKKADKELEAKARQLQIETFGDNDQYDEYDQMGADFEDDFF